MKRRAKSKKFRPVRIAVLFLAVLLLVARGLVPLFQAVRRNFLPVPKLSNKALSSVSPEGLNSRNAILVRVRDGRILMEKNSAEIAYPASMTKIMTAVVALKKLTFPDRRITLGADIFAEMERKDASMAGFLSGESVRTIDLLYGALLPSGGECCVGLARAVAGSEKRFADLMNEQAERLGMSNTHFVNSTGLHDANHYSTVRDIAVLLDYALGDSVFRKIFTAHSRHTSVLDNKKFGGITLQSTVFNGENRLEIPNGRILGGKTGFTQKAGYCMASLAQVGGREYILVTAGAPLRGRNIEDAVKVYSRI